MARNDFDTKGLLPTSIGQPGLAIYAAAVIVFAARIFNDGHATHRGLCRGSKFELKDVTVLTMLTQEASVQIGGLR
jgi:hypothetical protein